MTGTHVRAALDKLALAEHAWTNHNPFKWEEVFVIDRARTAKELLVKKAFHIRLNHPSLNRNGGPELPRCWMAALKDTRSRPKRRPAAPTDSSGDAMHHLGFLLHCQGVLHFGQQGAEGLSIPETTLMPNFLQTRLTYSLTPSV